MKHYLKEPAKIAVAAETLRKLTGCSISYTMRKERLTKGKLDGMERLEDLILSFDDFNCRDNEEIVHGSHPFRFFYESLPVGEYGEMNPNNGDALFSVELPDSATIILKGEIYDFNNKGKCFDRSHILKLAKEYGKAWHADEISVDVNRHKGFCEIEECVIRFWWD